jgi:hypothetical protein
MHAGGDAVAQSKCIAAVACVDMRTFTEAVRLAAGLRAAIREGDAGLLASKRTASAANRRSIFRNDLTCAAVHDVPRALTMIVFGFGANMSRS